MEFDLSKWKTLAVLFFFALWGGGCQTFNSKDDIADVSIEVLSEIEVNLFALGGSGVCETYVWVDVIDSAEGKKKLILQEGRVQSRDDWFFADEVWMPIGSKVTVRCRVEMDEEDRLYFVEIDD